MGTPTRLNPNMTKKAMTLLLLCAAMAIAAALPEMKETNDKIVPESAATADVVLQLRQEVASLRTELRAHKSKLRAHKSELQTCYDENLLQTKRNCCSSQSRPIYSREGLSPYRKCKAACRSGSRTKYRRCKRDCKKFRE